MVSEHSKAVLNQNNDQNDALARQNRPYDRTFPNNIPDFTGSGTSSGPTGFELSSRGRTSISMFNGATNTNVNGASFTIVDGDFIDRNRHPSPSQDQQGSRGYSSNGDDSPPPYSDHENDIALPPVPSWPPPQPPVLAHQSRPWRHNGPFPQAGPQWQHGSMATTSAEGSRPGQGWHAPNIVRGGSANYFQPSANNLPEEREYFDDLMKDKQWTPQEAYDEFQKFCDDTGYIAHLQCSRVINSREGGVIHFESGNAYRVPVRRQW